MEIIPCITLKKYKITNQSISLESISQYIKEEEILYILDLDGIQRNKPNICTFQKLSSNYQLWVDYGPRNIGDIVDIFMTGATSVTIRRALSPSLKISDIKDISENKVYLNIDFQDFKINSRDDLFLKEYDGFVNFNNKEEIEQDFKFGEHLNKIQKQNKIYSYENDVKNRFFWEKIGITGLLVDVNKLKEFKDGF
jgi:uncharacterized protein related to proFAR isomerase